MGSMEGRLLLAMGYQVSVPTVAHMLPRLQQANGCGEVHSSFVQYVLELALSDHLLLRYLPSMLASAALLMSNEYFGRRPAWPPAMVHCSQRSESSLRLCAAELLAALTAAPPSHRS